jgi:hypothetical protein
MAEAKVENFLAKKVVANPNELSGARPAVAATRQIRRLTQRRPVVTFRITTVNAKPATNANATKKVEGSLPLAVDSQGQTQTTVRQ